MNYRYWAFLLCTLLALSGLLVPLQSAGVSAKPAQAQQQNVTVSTNEGLAMKSLRALLNAETTFQNTVGKGEYGDLKQLRDAGLIDSDLASGLKEGFRFTVVFKKSTMSSQPAVDLVARPNEYPRDGRRSFYLTESGVLMFAEEKDAPLTSMRPFATGGGATKATEQESETSSTGEADEDEILSKVSANEASIITALGVIQAAEVKYIAKTGAGAYGTLDQLEKAGLINKSQSLATQHGYLLEVKIGPNKSGSPQTFSISAVPQTFGLTGRNSFFLDQTGIVRGADKEGGPADATDPPIN